VDHVIKEVGNALWKHSLKKVMNTNTVLKLFQAFLRVRVWTILLIIFFIPSSIFPHSLRLHRS